jgi:hypothetical protein
MSIPGHLLDDERPANTYSKSNLTWFVVAGAVLAIVPYVMLVRNFIQRAMTPRLFLEHLGERTQNTIDGIEETQKAMTNIEDLLTYVLMLFMGLCVFGILTGLIGTVIMLVNYNSQLGFKAVRAGCGTSLCCQGILIICAFTVWVSKALALYNGEVILNKGASDQVRVIYTPDRLQDLSTAVFLNDGMIWGVWIIMFPVFLMIYFAEQDLKRRQPKHI